MASEKQFTNLDAVLVWMSYSAQFDNDVDKTKKCI